MSLVSDCLYNTKTTSPVILFSVFAVILSLLLLYKTSGMDMEVETNPTTVSNNLICKESHDADKKNITESDIVPMLESKKSSLSLKLDGGKSSFRRFCRKIHDAFHDFHNKIKLAHHELSDSDDSDSGYSDSQLSFLGEVFRSDDENDAGDVDDDSAFVNAIPGYSSSGTGSRYHEFIDTTDYTSYPTLKTNNDEDYIDGQLIWTERRNLWNTQIAKPGEQSEQEEQGEQLEQEEQEEQHTYTDYSENINNKHHQEESEKEGSNDTAANDNEVTTKIQPEIPIKKYHIFYKYFILQSRQLKQPINLEQLALVIQNEWKSVEEIGTASSRRSAKSGNDGKKWKNGQYPMNYSRSIYGRG